MSKHYPGWPFTQSKLVHRIIRCSRSGVIVGFAVTAVPVEPVYPHIPMSVTEALSITGAIHPGALYELHRKGKADTIALRALQVTGVVRA